MEDHVDVQENSAIGLTADIVTAYVSHNHVQAGDLPALIATVHAGLTALDQAPPAEPQAEKPTPAQIRKSITPDALISFVDGKPYKALKRHLRGHGLTIETYRERYGLPKDYPSVAASYSEARSALATSLGLGRKPAVAAPASDPEPDPVPELAPAAPKRRGRKKAADPV